MKKEIIFGIGGGMVSYQLGIVKFMIEAFDKNYLKENFYFGGASAGSISSLILCAVINDIDSVDEWFNNFILKLVMIISKRPTGVLFKLNNLIYDIINVGYQKFNSQEKSMKFLNDKYHVVVTKLPSRKKKILTKFNHSKKFIDALSASCNAPIMTNKLYIRCDSDYCTDGIFCNQIPYRFEDSQKVYFSIFDQKLANCKTFNILKWGNLSLSNLWLWGNIENAKKLYFDGYNDCVKNKQMLIYHIMSNKTKINLFFSKLVNNQSDSNNQSEANNKYTLEK